MRRRFYSLKFVVFLSKLLVPGGQLSLIVALEVTELLVDLSDCLIL